MSGDAYDPLWVRTRTTCGRGWCYARAAWETWSNPIVRWAGLYDGDDGMRVAA